MANISGSWLGTYWQREIPTRFEASFVQGGNTVSGNILDDNGLGEACIAGEVVGRTIHFTKRYLASSFAIEYTGQIAEDEQSMAGTWLIEGFDSGQWEARRSGENLSVDLQALQSQDLVVMK